MSDCMKDLRYYENLYKIDRGYMGLLLIYNGRPLERLNDGLIRDEDGSGAAKSDVYFEKMFRWLYRAI